MLINVECNKFNFCFHKLIKCTEQLSWYKKWPFVRATCNFVKIMKQSITTYFFSELVSDNLTIPDTLSKWTDYITNMDRSFGNKAHQFIFM